MRKTLVVLFSLVLIFAIHHNNSDVALSQQLPNLKITNLTLTVDGVQTISIDAPGPQIIISAQVESEFASASGFNVSIQYRKDTEQTFRSSQLCNFVGQATTCSNLSINAGSSLPVRGTLNSASIEEPGRYIVRASVVPNNVQQTTVNDDFLETILLIGVNSPEYHPVSISFSPPSPISVGSQVTVRTEIENTGRPSSPQLEVAFEYCLRSSLECNNDENFEASGFTLGTNGVRTLGTSETTALSTGGLLSVTNVLDTTGFPQGQYEFRVTVRAIGEQELDPSNNEISTLLTLGGVAVAGAVCQLSGEITTLGSSIGKLSLEDGGMDQVNLLYVVTVDSSNVVQLHAINQDALADLQPSDECPEIESSPMTLGTNIDVTTFTIDDRSRLLYVGLSNGNLRVINTDRADRLFESGSFVTGAPLLSFSSRVANSTVGQLFIGTGNNQVLRVNVTKNTDGGLSVSNSQTCIQGTGSNVENVQIFAGKTYYSAGNGVFRFDETSCGSSTLERVFTGDAAVNALRIGRVTFGSIRTTRIVVGLTNGDVHVLTNIGTEVSGSPINVGGSITAMGINDGSGARSRSAESVFVATDNGIVTNINIKNVAECDTPFEISSGTRVNVLGIYEPDSDVAAFGGVTGWVFAGTEDSRLFVISDNCEQADTDNANLPSTSNPITTQSPIRSNILVQAAGGDLLNSAGSVIVTYGGGTGLFIDTIGIPLLGL